MTTALIDGLHQRQNGMFGGMLGVRFVEAEPDRLVAELLVRDEMCTVPGIMHGGAIMAFADEMGGMATGLNLPKGAGTTTIESKTNFFAPGRVGDTVRAECVALHRGKRTMVWQTRITSSEGRLLALVTQTQIVLEATHTPQQVIGALFEGITPTEQKALLAQLERGGAAVYQALAAAETDATIRAELLAAAEREVVNAEVLERQAE
jgi:1,4-dihydroxy-2-naphthoyl-CoA hydrolase